MSECKRCHAEIAWLRMPSGKMNPVNIEATVESRPDGKKVVAAVPHWSTCPFADQFKKKKEEEKDGREEH
jgi:hypothetical protein